MLSRRQSLARSDTPPLMAIYVAIVTVLIPWQTKAAARQNYQYERHERAARIERKTSSARAWAGTMGT
jgi:hypothetical protein